MNIELSNEEYSTALMVGYMSKMAQASPWNIATDAIQDIWSGMSTAVDTGWKSMLAVSLVTGIPMGIIAHKAGRKAKNRRKYEANQLAAIDHYNRINDSIENKMLAGAAAK